MLYRDTIAKETVLAVLGWCQKGLTVRQADLGKLQGDTRQDMALRKQLIDQLSGKNLEEVLRKTNVGSRVVEEQSGGDPTTVPDPGKKFAVTYADKNGPKKGFAELPREWVTSLVLMYCRGIETVPVVSQTAVAKLDKIVNDNPVIATPSEKLGKDVDTFLKVMKDDCKVPTEAAQAPEADDGDPDQYEAESQSVGEAFVQLEAVYDIVPDLSGHDLVPELEEVHDEYAKLPPPERGGGTGEEYLEIEELDSESTNA